jgi:WD40 repeat protein
MTTVMSMARDSFQAVFLVLGRKAGSNCQSESLDCWLHCVGFRTVKSAVAVCFSLVLMGSAGLAASSWGQSPPAGPQNGGVVVFAPQTNNGGGIALVPQAPAKPNDVWCVALSPDDKYVVAGGGWWDQPGEIGIWDLATRKLHRHFDELRGVSSVAFSPDSKLLASACWAGNVRLRDWQAGEEVGDLNIRGVSRIAFSPDGKLLAAASEGKIVRLWNLDSRDIVADLEGDLFRFHCVAFTPDGKRLLAGGGDWKMGGICQVNVWDVDSKKQLLTLKGHNTAILAVAVSHDGKTIASGGVDATIRLWDADSGQEIKTLRGHQGWVESLAFTSDSKTLLSSSHDLTIRFWDVAEGITTRQLGNPRVMAMPVGNGAERGPIRLFMPVKKEPGDEAVPWHFLTTIRAIRLTSDSGTLVAGGGPRTLRVFDVASGKETAALWESPRPRPYLPGNADEAQRALAQRRVAAQAVTEQPLGEAPPGRSRRWLFVLSIVVTLGLVVPALLVLLYRRRRRAP